MAFVNTPKASVEWSKTPVYCVLVRVSVEHINCGNALVRPAEAPALLATERKVHGQQQHERPEHKHHDGDHQQNLKGKSSCSIN